MRMLKFRYIAILCITTLLTGCGTITSIGEVGYDKVYVSTDQENTVVKLNGVPQNLSKGYILVDKTVDGNFISCTKSGYKTSNFYTQRKIHPGILTADIILSIPFVFIPLIVDGFNGEYYQIEPENITIFMSKETKWRKFY